MRKGKYRSKFEAKTAKFLRTRKVKFKYESMRILYTLMHSYKPDFILENGVIIETKGRFTSKDRTKMERICNENPQLDIRLFFMKDNPIYKGSTTRYSDWCTARGIKYCIGEIPDDWLH